MRSSLSRPHLRRWAFLATALLVVACSGDAERPQRRAPQVGVAQPIRRDVTLYNEFIGTTRASKSVAIRARVSGALEEMHFEPSSVVQEGDLLFVIEPLPYKAARDAAAADVASAKAELGRTESDLGRMQQAVRTDAVSRADVDLAQARRDVAAAAVLSAEAALERAELQLSYTRVASPIAGQVGRNLVDVGNLVGGAEPTVLTTVNKVRPLHVYFDAPEEAVLHALRSLDWAYREETGRPGAKEPVRAWAGTLIDDGFPYEGTVDYISNTVDPTTGTIEVRLVLPNEDLTLFPGLFVRVRASRGELPDAVLVEERAIGADLGGRFVYVVGKDGLVEQRYVELGPVQDDGTVPVLAGLEGGETYVVEGLLRARPGMPVDPQPLAEAGE